MHITDSEVLEENHANFSNTDFGKIETEQHCFEVPAIMEIPTVSDVLDESEADSEDTLSRMSAEDSKESKQSEVSEDFIVDRTGAKDRSIVTSPNGNQPLYSSIQRHALQKLANKAKEINSQELSIAWTPRVTTSSRTDPINFQRRVYDPRYNFSVPVKSNVNRSSSRYHVETDPRFSGMKAGVISETLRSALGIENNQLPLYIYRMRVLGYPPGHLENAIRQRSGILVFAADGCEVRTNGEVLEEGEVNEEEDEDDIAYDVNQLIEFPGFNADPPDGTLDECQKLRLPSIQEKQKKEAMAKILLLPRRERAKALKEQICSMENDIETTMDDKASGEAMLFSEEQNSAWLAEMGLDAADGWLILDAFTDTEEEEENNLKTKNSNHDKIVSQPSEHSLNISPSIVLSDSSNNCDVATKEVAQNILPPTVHDSPDKEQNSHCSFNDTDVDCMAKRVDGYGSSLDICSGTPLMVDNSFWSQILPDASVFSAGMTEQLPYENLPNSTGAFRKLRKVLTEARSRADCPYSRR